MSYSRRLSLIIVRKTRHSIYLLLLVFTFALVGIVSCFFRTIVDNYQNSVVSDIGYSLMLYRTDDGIISQEILDEISSVGYVAGYNQEANMLVQPVNFFNTVSQDENNIFSIPKTEMVRLYADTDISQNLIFSNNLKLIEGKLPSPTEKGALIDVVLATKNNILIGDKIVVKSQESGSEIPITVIGIYETITLPQESWTEPDGKIAYGQSPYSYIFCDFNTYENIAEHSFPLSSIFIYAKNMKDLAKVNALIVSMKLSEEIYRISNRTETQLNSGTSASRAINSIAILLTSISISVSAFVLFLVVLLWIRACYKDISILISMGESKCAIIRDYFLIITIITVLGLLIALPFSNLIVTKFGGFLIDYAFVASGNLSGLEIDNYMTFALDQVPHIIDYIKSNLIFLLVVYPVSNKTLRRWGNKVYFSKTDWRMEKCHAIL